MHYNYFKNTFTLFTIFILLISLNTYSQCTEDGFNFGNNTSVASYNISGDVSVTLNTDNTVTLSLASNFSTASGPDVRAYLVNSNGMSDTEIRSEIHGVENGINNLDQITFGLVSATGEQSFTVDIPAEKDITSFDKILFYCLRFEQFWDIGSFTSFTTNSCSVLSTEENAFNEVTVYPNPATSFIEIANLNTTNAEIRIFDLSGKKVFQQPKGDTKNTIDVSNLKTGIYVLSISENNKKFSKKLILQ